MARVFGLLLMIACAAAAYWLRTDDRFTVHGPLVAANVSYTDVPSLLTAVGLGESDHPNILTVRTDDLRRALLANPAVADAHVTTQLPNTVYVALSEYEPAFALEHAGSTLLVDADGHILAAVDPELAASLGLPVIMDFRSTPPEQAQPGLTVEPTDLASILHLGALTPATIDSQAVTLQLEIRDNDGFVLSAQPQGWQAIFGNYTANLRPVELIPRQVQCLRSVLGAHEIDVKTVYLAPLNDDCGTYLPASIAPPAAPRASSTPRSGR